MCKIKESNRWKIHYFILGSPRPDLNVQALYNLIQKKGEPIKTDDERWSNVKALKYSDKDYIAMKRTPIPANSDKFYPCKIHTCQLTLL